MAAYQRSTRTLSGEGEAERIYGAAVSGDYFRVLGVSPVIGRLFAPEEEKAANAVLIGHGLWRRRFGESPSALGRTLIIDGAGYTIVGVLPPYTAAALAPLHREEIWMPLRFDRVFRGQHNTRILARLKSGVILEQARQELNTIMSALESAYKSDNQGRGAYPIRARDDLTQALRRPLWVLLGGAGLLLVIAAANVANMLLARGAARERELGLRVAIGAGRGRILRQLATENLALAFVSGALGYGIAHGLVAWVLASAPSGLPRFDSIPVDFASFLFSLGVVLAVWLLFGLMPAWQTADASLFRAGHGHSSRLRHALIAGEVALAMILFCCAGLLARSYYRILRVDLGFRTANITAMSMSLPAARYAPPPGRPWPIRDWPAVMAFHDRALREVRAVPGVVSAAFGVAGFAAGAWTTRVTVVGRPVPPDGEQDEAEFRIVDPEYFRTLEVARRQGRGFVEADDGARQQVSIVNEAFVRKHFPEGSPIGSSIRIYGTQREIVGVVADARYDGAGTAAAPAMYVPYRQFPLDSLSIVVRSQTPRIEEAVRQAIRRADRELALFDVWQLDRLYASTLALRRFTLLLLGLFAAVSLLLSAIGVYALISFTVSRQSKEIGLRMALGANRANVFCGTVKAAVSRVAVGLVAGVAGTIAASRALDSLLFEVQPIDPITYGIGLCVMTSVALLAAAAPALRASRMDPASSLRHE